MPGRNFIGKMGWRDMIKEEEEEKKLPEMTTIYDAQTQSIQLILWSDYVGKGYQVRKILDASDLVCRRGEKKK